MKRRFVAVFFFLPFADHVINRCQCSKTTEQRQRRGKERREEGDPFVEFLEKKPDKFTLSV